VANKPLRSKNSQKGPISYSAINVEKNGNASNDLRRTDSYIEICYMSLQRHSEAILQTVYTEEYPMGYKEMRSGRVDRANMVQGRN
jgi:hypothetical protein